MTYNLFQPLAAEITTCNALNAMSSKSIERMLSLFYAVNFGACLYEEGRKKWVIVHNKWFHGRNRVKTEASDILFYREHLVFEHPKTFNYALFLLVVGNIPTRTVPWLSQVVLMILLPGRLLRGSTKNEHTAWSCHKEKL